ncbi:MAG: membrane protein insertion efficiency factor YidD [bacterium]
MFKFIISLPKKAGLAMIRIYQFLFSMDHSFWAKKTNHKLGRVCIYYPSCSEYTYEAIEKFGLIKGSISGAFRIIRCNPFNAGGEDPLKNNWRNTLTLTQKNN